MNKLIHVGLQVTKSDIESFYIDILGGEIIRTFTLSAKDAKVIFGLRNEINAFIINCKGLVLELFVNEEWLTPSCSHICLFSDKAEQIAQKAEKNYPLYIRRKYENDTYFIKDSNNNLFEIKYKS